MKDRWKESKSERELESSVMKRSSVTGFSSCDWFSWRAKIFVMFSHTILMASGWFNYHFMWYGTEGLRLYKKDEKKESRRELKGKSQRGMKESRREMTSHSFHPRSLFSSIDSLGFNETDLHSNNENERKRSIEGMEQKRVRIEVRNGKRGQCSNAELAISLL